MEVKVCTKCKKDKSINEFGKNVNTKDGLAYWCRDCFKEYNIENRQRIKQTKMNYKDRAAANSRKHYEANREEIKTKNKKHYQKVVKRKKEKKVYNALYYRKQKLKVWRGNKKASKELTDSKEAQRKIN